MSYKTVILVFTSNPVYSVEQALWVMKQTNPFLYVSVSFSANNFHVSTQMKKTHKKTLLYTHIHTD